MRVSRSRAMPAGGWRSEAVRSTDMMQSGVSVPYGSRHAAAASVQPSSSSSIGGKSGP